jgi:uncharacterized protein (TIGR00725 family)
MNISVFGGSQPMPGEAAYEEALRFGKLLGAAGYTVLTGGYIGTMEAISQGAAIEGAHVIGVTCEEIEAWRRIQPNRWVTEEWRCISLQDRLMKLIKSCDAACALPGGPGTLTEIALTWNLLLTESISPRPLILIGPAWDTVFETIFDTLGSYIPDDQRRWLTFAPNVDAAAELIAPLTASLEN